MRSLQLDQRSSRAERDLKLAQLGVPTITNDAGGGSLAASLHEFWVHRELLYFLTWRDVKVRYKQSFMGAAWAIIQPLVLMLVFVVFFGFFVGVPTDGMPHVTFFYTGLLPWTFFANAITNSSMSIAGNSGLITKAYFPRLILPASAVGAGLVDLLIASLILVGLTVYYKANITWSILWLPFLISMVVLLAFGVGAGVAALTAKYRDVRHALPFVLQFWFFVTPIIYPASVAPPKWRWMLSINPMTAFIEGIRASLFGRAIDRTAVLVATILTFGIVACSVYAFHRIERSFADLV